MQGSSEEGEDSRASDQLILSWILEYASRRNMSNVIETLPKHFLGNNPMANCSVLLRQLHNALTEDPQDIEPWMVENFETLVASCSAYAPQDMDDPMKLLVDLKTKLMMQGSNLDMDLKAALRRYFPRPENGEESPHITNRRALIESAVSKSQHKKKISSSEFNQHFLSKHIDAVGRKCFLVKLKDYAETWLQRMPVPFLEKLEQTTSEGMYVPGSRPPPSLQKTAGGSIDPGPKTRSGKQLLGTSQSVQQQTDADSWAGITNWTHPDVKAFVATGPHFKTVLEKQPVQQDKSRTPARVEPVPESSETRAGDQQEGQGQQQRTKKAKTQRRAHAVEMRDNIVASGTIRGHRRDHDMRGKVGEEDGEMAGVMSVVEAERLKATLKNLETVAGKDPLPGALLKTAGRVVSRKAAQQPVANFDDEDDDDAGESGVASIARQLREPAMHPLRTSMSMNHTAQNLARGRKRSRWTVDEESYIQQGVEQFGEGHWADILSAFPFAPGRTGVGIKDKWRNMNI